MDFRHGSIRGIMRCTDMRPISHALLGRTSRCAKECRPRRGNIATIFAAHVIVYDHRNSRGKGSIRMFASSAIAVRLPIPWSRLILTLLHHASKCHFIGEKRGFWSEVWEAESVSLTAQWQIQRRVVNNLAIQQPVDCHAFPHSTQCCLQRRRFMRPLIPRAWSAGEGEGRWDHGMLLAN